MRQTIFAISTVILIGGAVAVAQQHHPQPLPHAEETSDSRLPQGIFNVRAYSQVRTIMQKMDFSPKVDLAASKATQPTDALGALSGLRGEVSMIDGRYIVSYGGGCQACPPPHDEKATLLGTARVKEWHAPIVLTEALAGKALDAFIIGQAKAKRIDTDKPFPVRLVGSFTGVKMHVIEAPNPGFSGHGSKTPIAKQDEFAHEQIGGIAVGFYMPPTMFAVLTHPGEPFHFHWIDEDRTRTAHLDAFGMAKGAQLLLPKE